jgi:hypothetical protein
MSKTFEPPHDPNEVKDWSLDWSLVLETGETISTSTWSVALGAGLTIDSQSNTTTTTTVWLSGGTAGFTYELLNRIVTNSSPARTYDQTMRLRCRNK